ncbi:MAG: dephospho-CoA kinase [Candidatus Binatia bacterium]
MPDPVKTIGLTGGIGSGKSTVAKILAECGALVIHADTVGHEMYRPQSDGWRQVVQAFGADVLATDQSVDRKKLGAIVFADPQALKRLNAIVHPLIFAAIRDQIRTHRTAGRAQPIVVEAALLIEANWLPLVEEVWLVVAGKQAVIARVTAERGLAPRDVETRINAQLSDDARRRYAQVVIENTGSLEALHARVRAAWARSIGDVA